MKKLLFLFLLVVATPAQAPFWTQKFVVPGFTQPRSLSERLFEHVNVKEFGAKGGGTNDDTNPVQAGIDKVASMGGGELFFPEGVYVVRNLEMRSGVHITGRATLRHFNNVAIDTGSFWLLHFGPGVVDASVSGITFDGNLSSQPPEWPWDGFRHAIKMSDASGITVRDCIFTNLIGDGIYIGQQDFVGPPLVGCRDVIIDSCRFIGDSLNRNGISIACATNGIINNCTFTRMGRGTEPGAIDIETHSADEFIKDWRITGNQFNGHPSITATDLQSGIAVINNQFSGQVQGISVVGNIFDGNFRYVLNFFGSTNQTDSISLSDNFVRNSTYTDGIGLISKDINLQSTGDTFENINGRGIWVQSGLAALNDVRIFKAGFHGIQLSGTNSVINNAFIVDAGNNSVDGSRSGIFLANSNNVINGAFIGSTHPTKANTLNGITSSGTGSSNTISGVVFRRIGTRNWNLGATQIMGINYPDKAISSFDIVPQRLLIVSDNAHSSDKVALGFGGVKAENPAISRPGNGDYLQIEKGDGSAFADLRAANITAANFTLPTGDVQAQLNAKLISYLTTAAMTAQVTPVAGAVAYVRSYATVGDGGGGVFYYDPASAATIDGGLVFNSVSGGRWLRQYSGPIDIRWYGAIGNDSFDNFSVIRSAYANVPSGSEIRYPEGIYRVTASATINKPLRISGTGTLKAMAGNFPLNVLGVGSSGTEITGIRFDSVSVLANIQPGIACVSSGISNVVIRGCSFGRVGINLFDAIPRDQILGNQNLVIESCFFNGNYAGYVYGSFTAIIIEIGDWDGFRIQNNTFDTIEGDRVISISGFSQNGLVDGNNIKATSSSIAQVIDGQAARKWTLSNNKITARGSWGSALECKSGSVAIPSETLEIEVVNNNIDFTSDNAGASGLSINGGWGLDIGTQPYSSAVVANNKVYLNIPNSQGGMIVVRGFTAASVSGNTCVRSNVITFGGGVSVDNNRSASISGNVIERGIITVTGRTSPPTGSTYTNSPQAVTITGNTIRDYHNQGAIFFANDDGLTNVVITGNTIVATGPSGGSGLIYVGPGTLPSKIDHLVITGNSGTSEIGSYVVIDASAVIGTRTEFGNSWVDQSKIHYATIQLSNPNITPMTVGQTNYFSLPVAMTIIGSRAKLLSAGTGTTQFILRSGPAGAIVSNLFLAAGNTDQAAGISISAIPANTQLVGEVAAVGGASAYGAQIVLTYTIP